MKHKHYMKPTIKVVQLRQQCHILAGSELSATAGVQDYTMHNELEE